MKNFNSFIDFAHHLGMRLAADHVETRESLEECAEFLKKKIKERFGNYMREDAGSFKEWAELADYTKYDRVRQGYTPNDPLLRSGKLRDSVESEVKSHLFEHVAVIGSKEQIMVWQELGTSRIPPRSVFGAEAYINRKKIEEVIGISAAYRIAGRSEKVRI